MLPLQTHDTSWDPAKDVRVTLNITLDACFVPSSSGSTRVDLAHLVVLDDFFGEEERQQLLDYITQPGWDHTRGPPDDKWERATCDAAFLPRTWGLKDEVLKELLRCELKAKIEIQSRLSKLYPEMIISHMPSDLIQCQDPVVQDAETPQVPQEQAGTGEDDMDKERQGSEGNSTATEADCLQAPGQGPQATGQAPEHQPDQEAEGDVPATIDCNAFVANAAVPGDSYSWHVDADPWTLPCSSWTQEHGHYFNREPGKPLFVSMLLYLNEDWPRDKDAETLFLDTPTDTGIIIRPKKYRAVLMDQDVVHRLSVPSRTSEVPRYSLVWKLVFLPRHPGQQCSLARPEWGDPTAFGSAAKLEAAVQQLAAKRQRTK